MVFKVVPLGKTDVVADCMIKDLEDEYSSGWLLALINVSFSNKIRNFGIINITTNVANTNVIMEISLTWRMLIQRCVLHGCDVADLLPRLMKGCSNEDQVAIYVKVIS